MDTTMQNQNVAEKDGGFLSETREYVVNNPITAAAGVAFIAGATLFIASKVGGKSSDAVEVVSDMASAVATKSGKAAGKAAKYALMMRH